jgi:outer membrane lipoprotein-sorting protein
MNRAVMAITIVLGIALVPVAADACTLMRTTEAKNAELRVYFTKFAKEDKTGGKYKSCRIVRQKESETKMFYVTPFRQDANVVVHRSNWPR